MSGFDSTGTVARERHVSVACEERDFFIDNLLVRIHFIIVMILIDRPCAMELDFFSSR